MWSEEESMPEVRNVVVIIVRLGEHDSCLRKGPQRALQMVQSGCGCGGAAEVPADHLLKIRIGTTSENSAGSLAARNVGLGTCS